MKLHCPGLYRCKLLSLTTSEVNTSLYDIDTIVITSEESIFHLINDQSIMLRKTFVVTLEVYKDIITCS